MSDGPLNGKWPGEVVSYDAAARTCRVSIEGLTDGSSVLPEAVFEYPIGDRADASSSKDHTEIRILPGDAVWLEFEKGDPRFPIITGYRLKRAANPTNWRRWRHANIEMTADGDMVLNATNLILNISGNVTELIGGNRATDIGGNETTDVSGNMDSTAAASSHQAATHELTAQTQIAGAITTTAGPGGAGAQMAGPIAFLGGSVTHDGVKIDKTHRHTEQGDGQEVSTPH